MTTLDEATRKRLTLFIGEEWNPNPVDVSTLDREPGYEGCYVSFLPLTNRTFILDADMLAVYGAIWKAGKWGGFELYAGEYWYTYHWQVQKKALSLNAWLLCLSNPAEIPDRMRMVAEWMERQEEAVLENLRRQL